MIFSIHQPNYIPYLGYFYKILRSDYFVILDAVQYPRGQSYSPRNKIKTPQGEIYLTVPVSIPRDRQGKVTYREVSIAGDRWKARHIKTIEMNYKSSPYFGEVISLYSDIITRDYTDICRLNSELIKAVCDYLGIKTRILYLSDLLDSFGSKTYLIIDIGKRLNASVYLSGTGGGKDYNDGDLMREHGIELVYSDFRHPVYPQLWGEFIPNLSVLDYIFNCGPDLSGISNFRS
jgi:hypothetical protein